MGKRKNNHYIPKFYLRRFSLEEQGKSIGLYNLKNDIFIPSAPIKHQASKDYLYGEDGEIELYLSKLEDAIAKFFWHWTEEKTLIPPPKNSNAFKLLKRFILYQIHRIPKAGEEINDSSDRLFKTLVDKFDLGFKDKVDNLKLVYEEPVLQALAYSIDKEHFLDFLDIKFLVNLSDLPFITSDSPVILYNQLMEKRGSYKGATALGAKGLQIFYPIHPRLMICLFDDQVYTYGEKDNCISTELIEDAHALNRLQYLNCHNQIFFNHWIIKDYVDIIKNNQTRESSAKKSYSHLLETIDGKTLLHTTFETPKIGLELSFCTLKDDTLKKGFQSFALRHKSFYRKSDDQK